MDPKELEDALYASNGNKAAAARALGIPITTLKNALDRHGIEYKPRDEVIEEWCAANGVPIDDVSGYWHKTDEMSVFVRRKSDTPDYMAMRDEICEEMRAHAPAYKPISYDPSHENLFVIDPADVHFGKYAARSEVGEDYDVETAAERFREGVSGLLAKAAVHGIHRIVIVLGNDALHTDNARRTTTSGTPQDSDGQWHEAFDVAKRCYVAFIEEAAKIAPVHLVHVPANHDFVTGYMLTDTIVSWFHNHPGVTAERRSVDMKHRKYLEYGRNLLAFTHGDGAKESDLKDLAMKEARESFARTDRTWWHCHHLHHKIRKVDGLQVEKDHIGATVIRSSAGKDRDDACIVEYIRSPSASDGWHHRNGYTGAVQAIEAFIYSPSSQIARFTHEF